MKRILSILAVLSVLILSLVSCGSAEEYYENWAIRVTVAHISCFDTEAEYDLYLDDIIVGEKYELPCGDANTYRVEMTVTAITREKITLSFSLPMDEIGDPMTRAVEVTTFDLSMGESRGFGTPTAGGGDNFTFSIVHKSEIPVPQD